MSLPTLSVGAIKSSAPSGHSARRCASNSSACSLLRSTCLPPPSTAGFRYTTLRWWILKRLGWMQCYSHGIIFRHTRSLHLASFLAFWPRFVSLGGLELTLVAPFWPLKPWFPDLLELLVEVPVHLQARRDLLRQPHFHHFHRNLRALQLTGFLIASDPRGPSDSLLRWLTNLPVADAPLPGVTTSLSG